MMAAGALAWVDLGIPAPRQTDICASRCLFVRLLALTDAVAPPDWCRLVFL